MSFRAHHICVHCFAIKRPDLRARCEELAKTPGENDEDRCCYCGKLTSHGIYVRDENPPFCGCIERAS